MRNMDYFVSPTKGRLTFDAMFDDIAAFIHAAPNEHYNLIVGSDSQVRDGMVFVTAVVIHRAGKGARYYYSRSTHRRIQSLRQKIFYETSLSLGLAGRIAERLSQNGTSDNLSLEIHLDVGPNGETKELIREIVGMVVGSGFRARIKPDAYGASTVADKYTK